MEDIFKGFNLELGKEFFGFDPEYKDKMLEELFVLVHHSGFGYSDLMQMPVYHRKTFLHYLRKIMEERNNQVEGDETKHEGAPPKEMQNMENLGKTKFEVNQD